MQRGLNIGIASWIDAQYGSGALPALPEIAIPFKLRHLSDLESAEDLARAAELSLLANRLGDASPVYNTSGIPKYLWERHQENIRDMITATLPLSQTQREELARADSVLYKADGFTISDQYALYNETKAVYEDLVTQDAGAADVQAAYTNWITLGHKALVEEAIATKLSLSRTTSRLPAQNDMIAIEHALTTLGGDVPYAPTLFAPLSAVSPEYWVEAEVDLEALEAAIGPQVAHTSWRQFRGNKRGKVRFRFIGVDLIRPWFTISIYEADDWRLAAGPDVIVASGNGSEGTLPAYYSRIYLAQILDIRYFNAASPIRPKPALARLASARKPVVMWRGLSPAARHGAVAAPASAGSGKARRSLQRPVRSVSLGSKAGKIATPHGLAQAIRTATAVHRPSKLEAKPHIKLGTSGKIAIIRKMDAAAAFERVSFVQAFLVTPAVAAAPRPPETETYLVGFGRTNLPSCPNPNPNYQWP